MSRINGKEELWVGGIFSIKRNHEEFKSKTRATHVLSALSFDLEKHFKTPDHALVHKSFDLNDFDDEDILSHIPEAVRFIEGAFYPTSGAVPSVCVGAGSQIDTKTTIEGSEQELEERVGIIDLNEDPPPLGVSASVAPVAAPSASSALAAQPAGPVGCTTAMATPANKKGNHPEPVNSVFVHCAMGKSRSVTIVVAWLLYKYPQRWRLSSVRPSSLLRAQQEPMSESSTPTPAPSPSPSPLLPTGRLRSTPQEAVERATNWVRDSRSIAEPNPGFQKQLELWWEMGCPVVGGEMDEHPIYQRWLYNREVDAAVSVGMPPDRVRFEDEAFAEGRKKGHIAGGGRGGAGQEGSRVVKCHKCRRFLCDERFMVKHSEECGHIYVEPLSWMKETLEKGEMEGRLVCPGGDGRKGCGWAVGRYSWKGFKCGCQEWVAPVFSLQKGKVDVGAGGVGATTGGNTEGGRGVPKLNIRMPIPQRQGNL